MNNSHKFYQYVQILSDHEINDLLHDLEKKIKNNIFLLNDQEKYKKQTKEYTTSLIFKLQQFAEVYGLNRNQMISISNVLATMSPPINKRFQRDLISALLPRDEMVDDKVIKNLLGSLCILVPESRIKLFQWLIMIYQRLSKEALQSLRCGYGLLFHYIDYEKTRTLLCHLLYLLTRRKDVTPFRIERLKSITMKMMKVGENIPSLLLLYDLYAQYEPDLISAPPKKFSRPNGSFFKIPDSNWQNKLDMAIVRNDVITEKGSLETDNSEDKEKITENKTKLIKNKTKNSKIRKLFYSNNNQFLPEVYSKRAKFGQIDVNEVETTYELGRALCVEKIAFPDQCIALLSDKMFQYLICLDPTEEQVKRLRHCLPYMIEDCFFSANLSSKKVSKKEKKITPILPLDLVKKNQLLIAMVNFCDFSQQILPELEHFLRRFLHTWNGIDHIVPILCLISRLQPRTYDELHQHILQSLYRVYQSSQVIVKVQIISCLIDLLRNWAEIDWEKHYTPSVPGSILLEENNNAVCMLPVKKMRKSFVSLNSGLDLTRSIFELVGYIDQLLLIGLITDNDHVCFQLEIRNFFNTVANFFRKQNIPFVVPPSPGLTYRLLLAPTGVGTNMLCDILIQLHNAFIQLRSYLSEQISLGREDQILSRLTVETGLEKMRVYNSFILDACNTLWLKKPLPRPIKSGQTRSLLFHDNNFVDGLHQIDQNKLINSFSLTHSLAFSGFGQSFAKNIIVILIISM